MRPEGLYQLKIPLTPSGIYKFKKSQHGEINFLALNCPHIYNLNSKFLNRKTHAPDTRIHLRRSHTQLLSEFVPSAVHAILASCFVRLFLEHNELSSFVMSEEGRLRACNGSKSKLTTKGVT
jgi:hypothetical protein